MMREGKSSVLGPMAKDSADDFALVADDVGPLCALSHTKDVRETPLIPKTR